MSEYKDYVEKMKDLKPRKKRKEPSGLEALERIGKCDLHSEREDYYFLKNVYVNEYKTIKKELKALEIIKEKKVDVGVLTYVITISSNPLKDYNETIWEDEKENRLTQEQFDLLKEVLL